MRVSAALHPLGDQPAVPPTPKQAFPLVGQGMARTAL